ncbi:hypothetical protein HMPREF9621_02057 [Cutibacterium modestum HL037PA2]|nr:hypothetical protein HMPREF9621_02057 [Cutibacterium modestum HL037PA2]
MPLPPLKTCAMTVSVALVCVVIRHRFWPGSFRGGLNPHQGSLDVIPALNRQSLRPDAVHLLRNVAVAGDLVVQRPEHHCMPPLIISCLCQ